MEKLKRTAVFVRFSIVTVCFNSAKTIRQTLDSVLSQDFDDYEYIVVDGASTDGTIDIIKEYEPKFQGRMRWLSEPDTGIYNAMNKGIRLASGEFVAFMNSDDYYEPHAFEKVADAIRQNPDFNIFYGLVRGFDKAGREKYLIRYSHNNLADTCICHQSIFTKADLLRDADGYDESFKIVADHDFLLKIAADGSGRFYPIDCIVANYSEGGVSGSRQNLLREYWRLQMKNGIISKRRYRYFCASFMFKTFFKKMTLRSC